MAKPGSRERGEAPPTGSENGGPPREGEHASQFLLGQRPDLEKRIDRIVAALQKKKGSLSRAEYEESLMRLVMIDNRFIAYDRSPARLKETKVRDIIDHLEALEQELGISPGEALSAPAALAREMPQPTPEAAPPARPVEAAPQRAEAPAPPAAAEKLKTPAAPEPGEEIPLDEPWDPVYKRPETYTEPWPGTRIVLRDDPGSKETLLIKRAVGLGTQVDVLCAQRIRDDKKSTVAVRMARHELGMITVKEEIKALHALRAAILGEPEAHFPDGKRRNYAPIPYSGSKVAEQGIAVVEYCEGESGLEYARKVSPRERYALACQIVHALALAERAGILNGDIKDGDTGADAVLISKDGTPRLLDWNITYSTSNPNAPRNRKRIINCLMSICDAIVGVVPRGSHAAFKFAEMQGTEHVELIQLIKPPSHPHDPAPDFIRYMREKHGEGADQRIQDINARALASYLLQEHWSPEIALIVTEAIVEGKFSTIGALYERMLELKRNRPELTAAQWDEIRKKINAFNATFPQRKEEWEREQVKEKK